MSSDGYRRLSRNVGGALAVLAFLVAGSACSGSDDEGQARVGSQENSGEENASEKNGGGEAGGGTGGYLLQALDGVRFEGLPEAVTVVNGTRSNELLAADAERFRFVAELGTPLLGHYTVPEHRFGLDRANAETAVTIGQGDPYGFWRGDFDEAAITADLAGDGFTEQDAVWTDQERGLGFQVSADEIAWGGADLDPAALTAGEPLAEQPDYQALSACLGDVYRADLIQPDADEPVGLRGFGQLAASPGDTSEVLCALTGNQVTAEQAAEALREQIDEEPDRYPGAEVVTLDGESPGVRVTLPHTGEHQEPGWLVRDDIDLTLALNLS